MNERTRRRFLVGSASICGALAGCVGDDEDPDNGRVGNDDHGEGNGQGGDEQNGDDTGADDGGDAAIGEDLDRPALGDDDAPVTVTVYEDFSCPGCRLFKQQAFPRIVEEYVEYGDVKYHHGDLPVPVDETWSWAIPSAARELFEAEGDDAFWTFASEIFGYQEEYSYDVIETVAEDVAGLGVAARDAAENESHRGTIEVDRERAIEMGATATPTVFVDGEVVDPSFEAVSRAIEDRL